MQNRKTFYIFTVDTNPDKLAAQSLADLLCGANPDQSERMRHFPKSRRLTEMTDEQLPTVVFLGSETATGFGEYTAATFCERFTRHLETKKLLVKNLCLIVSGKGPLSATIQRFAQEVVNQLASNGFNNLAVYAVAKPEGVTSDQAFYDHVFQSQHLFNPNESVEQKSDRVAASLSKTKLTSSASDGSVPVLPQAHRRSASSSTKSHRRESERAISRHKTPSKVDSSGGGESSPQPRAKYPSHASPSASSLVPAPSSSPLQVVGTPLRLEVEGSPSDRGLRKTTSFKSTDEMQRLFMAQSAKRIQELNAAQSPASKSVSPAVAHSASDKPKTPPTPPKEKKRTSDQAHIVVRPGSGGSPKSSPSKGSFSLFSAAQFAHHDTALLAHYKKEITKVLEQLKDKSDQLHNQLFSCFFEYERGTIKAEMDALETLFNSDSPDELYRKVQDTSIITDRVLRGKNSASMVDLLETIAPKTIKMRR